MREKKERGKSKRGITGTRARNRHVVTATKKAARQPTTTPFLRTQNRKEWKNTKREAGRHVAEERRSGSAMTYTKKSGEGRGGV